MNTADSSSEKIKILPFIAIAVLVIVGVALGAIWMTAPAQQRRTLESCTINEIGGSRGDSIVRSTCGDFDNTGGLTFQVGSRYDLVVRSTNLAGDFVESATLSDDQ